MFLMYKIFGTVCICHACGLDQCYYLNLTVLSVVWPYFYYYLRSVLKLLY